MLTLHRSSLAKNGLPTFIYLEFRVVSLVSTSLAIDTSALYICSKEVNLSRSRPTQTLDWLIIVPALSTLDNSKVIGSSVLLACESTSLNTNTSHLTAVSQDVDHSSTDPSLSLTQLCGRLYAKAMTSRMMMTLQKILTQRRGRKRIKTAIRRERLKMLWKTRNIPTPTGTDIGERINWKFIQKQIENCYIDDI